MDTAYFKDKVVIVTGASSGIGLASAKVFGSYGARVVMASRSLDRMLELAPQVSSDPDKVLCVKTDVSVEADCRNLVEETVAKFGGIDILVNNAGVSMRAMFKDLELKVIHTPGHSPGSAVFYCEEEKAAFTGDTLFKEDIGRSDLLFGWEPDLMQSLKMLTNLLPDDCVIWPGHDMESTMGYEKQNNRFIQFDR